MAKKTTAKNKNTVEGSEFTAQGNINVGDTTTVNVFGMETNQQDFRFFRNFFVGLITFFALATLVLIYWPNPDERMGSFFCGGFFALSLLALVVMIRSKTKPSITIN